MAHHEEVTDLMAEIASLRAELERAKKHAADMNDGWRKANFENHDLRAERDLALRQRDHHIGILDKFEREAGIAARQDAEEKARLTKVITEIDGYVLHDGQRLGEFASHDQDDQTYGPRRPRLSSPGERQWLRPRISKSGSMA